MAPLLGDLPPGAVCVLVEGTTPNDYDVVTTTMPGAAEPQHEAGGFALYPLDPRVGRVTIGRRSHNDIIVADQRVSGQHAALELVTPGSYYWLTDLGSSNGTTWQGMKLDRGDAGRVLVPVGASFAIAGINVALINRDRVQALVTAVMNTGVGS